MLHFRNLLWVGSLQQRKIYYKDYEILWTNFPSMKTPCIDTTNQTIWSASLVLGKYCKWFYSILLINNFLCVNSAVIPRQLMDVSKSLMKIQNTVSICRIASLFLMTFTLDNMSSWMYFLLHCLLLTPGLSNMELRWTFIKLVKDL